MQLIDIAYIIVYSIIIYCSILWFTVFFKNRKKMFYNPEPKRFPSITFLIPAHNEEKNIGKCLKSILSLNYPKNKLKVIVIDDGSTDKTAEMVKKFKKVKLLRQKQQGKAAALNNGLKYVNTELVACMDADSFPDKDFLVKMIGYMERKNVASVTPAIKVLEPKTLMQKIQWVEYLWSIFLRKLFNFFDCQYVTPGPGSIYKTNILKKVGGFDEDNLTEDTEIAFRLVDKGYKIENSIDAYVYTEAPPSFKGLFRQRIRWYRGYIQNVFKYSKMIANPKYGNLGFFVLPINFAWMFILGFLLFSQLFTFAWNGFQYFLAWRNINFAILQPEIKFDIFLIDFYTYFLFLFLAMGLFTLWVSIAFSGEKLDLRKKLSFYLSYIFIYPFLISIFWVASIIYEIAGAKRKW
jgi:cellulose synthase/poly-beta-1,6-N-acetylglucosamine synthase-like glycosyltransferase